MAYTASPFHRKPVTVMCDPGSPHLELYRQLSHFGCDLTVYHTEAGFLAEVDAPERQSGMVVIVERINDYTPLSASGYQRLLQCPVRPGIIGIASGESVIEEISLLRAGVSTILNAPVSLPILIEAITHEFLQFSQPPYRIIIAAGCSPWVKQITTQLEQAGYATEQLTDPQLLQMAITHSSPDLVLLEKCFSEYTGEEMASVIRKKRTLPVVPLLLLDHDPIPSTTPAMDGVVHISMPPQAMMDMIGAKMDAYREILRQMSQDSLTGTLNQSRLEEQLEREVNRGRREIAPFSVMRLDIDGLQEINAYWGYETGDLVVRSLAQLLQHRLRNTDYIGRVGGGEFEVILPNTPQNFVEEIAEELRSSFAQLQHQVNGREFCCTMTAGYSSYLPGMSAIQLSNQAQQALFQAKLEGKNRVHRYTPGTSA